MRARIASVIGILSDRAVSSLVDILTSAADPNIPNIEANRAVLQIRDFLLEKAKIDILSETSLVNASDEEIINLNRVVNDEWTILYKFLPREITETVTRNQHDNHGADTIIALAENKRKDKTQTFQFFIVSVLIIFSFLYMFLSSFVPIPEANVRIVDTSLGFIFSTVINTLLGFIRNQNESVEKRDTQKESGKPTSSEKTDDRSE